jgi:nucleoside-diphosphate-sugar epimerase
VKRILLTGASGFVGRHAITPLLDAGYEVHAVTRHPPEATGARVHWHQADLLLPGTAKAVLQAVQPTHLMHLAWDVEPGAFWTSPKNLQWVTASLALMEAAANVGVVRIVMAGSSAEYDWHSGICLESSTPLRAATLYGSAKHALQTLATAYLRECGVSFAWGRIFFLYGPGEDSRRLVPTVIQKLLAKRKTPVTSGDQIRDFLHVQDVAEAFVALLNSSVEGPVNIASGNPLPVKTLISVISEKLNGNEFIEWGALAMPANDPPELRADVSRLTNEVGWRPRYDLETGISGTIKEWRKILSGNI